MTSFGFNEAPADQASAKFLTILIARLAGINFPDAEAGVKRGVD